MSILEKLKQCSIDRRVLIVVAVTFLVLSPATALASSHLVPFETFEDGDTDDWTGDIEVTSDSFEGEFAGKLLSDGSEARRDSPPLEELRVVIKTSDVEEFSALRFENEEGDGQIEFRNGDLTFNGADSIETLEQNVENNRWYEIYIDFNGLEADIVIDGEQKGAFNLSSGADNPDSVALFSNGGEIFADNFEGIEVSDPILDNPSPSGGETVQETPVELSIDVEDADFDTEQGDEVTATAYDASDDTEIGSQTLFENGTATVSWSDPDLGANSYYWVAEDEYGNTVESSVFDFRTPNEIEIRNESDPEQLVEVDGDAEVTFFEEGGEEVVERPVEDGTVDLQGLPATEYIIVVEIDGFETRQAIIEDITEQQNVYVLPEDEENVQVRFRLEDPTGQFTEGGSRLFIEKPITQNSTTRYRVIAADVFGATGYQTTLEQGQRYRLRVVSDAGQSRTFTFTAEETEQVTLELSNIEFEFDTEEGYSWDATLTDDDQIRFAWDDDDGVTESVSIQILNQTTRDVEFEDTIAGNGTTMFDVSDQDANTTTWIVEWEAVRGGDTIEGATTVGASQLPVSLPGVPDEVLSIVGFGVTLLMGGLFSRQNATIGAIVTPLIAGMFWYIGWIPSAVSGILIALALFLGVIVHMMSTRSDVPGV
ncbi:hypothetical protein ACFSUP_04375 [Gracilibacillus thailandensis]|uniref:hypothetical protein n=1 Tax=Gracilibacillus thailandensis TaxID=563735 RepID=UPI00364585B8